MKTLGFKAILGVVLLWSGAVTGFGQANQPEVPGDNFSLEGALELFKKSSSPEEFEKMLNTRDTKVNNLDLNGDGYIDYVRVIDLHEGDIHTFVLQAVVAEDEFQDIAVIALEKQANGKAILQITGNEDIYGVTTIIEPTKEVRTYAGTRSSNTVVNVWAWPVVQYVYGPRYTVWVSPWRWHYRPVWWSPWRPVAYYDYYPIWRPYYHYYAVCPAPRVYVHHIYHPHRRTSTIVHRRYNTQIVHYRENYDRNGRTRDDRRYINNNSGAAQGRQRLDASNTRQRIDANNTRHLDRRSTTTRSSTPTSRDRSAVRENGSNERQSLTRPSSTQRTLPGNRQSGTVERRSATAPQRSAIPGRDEASRMRAPQDATPQHRVAPSDNRTAAPSRIQRPNTSQRNSAVQRERAPAQVQRAPAQIQRSAPANSRQRQQVSPSRQRDGSSGSRPAVQRRSDNSGHGGAGTRGRR